jgi:transcriptional regulator with XRE-family HTH domain
MAERVKAARVHSGLSQIELGELMGMSARGIAYWETGARLPGLRDLCKLAVYCDVSVAHFAVPLDEQRAAVASGR